MMYPVWIVLLLLGTAHKGLSACIVNEEGSTNITCTSVPSIGLIEWTIENVAGAVTCNTASCIGAPEPAFPTIITKEGTTYTSTLTLKGESRKDYKNVNFENSLSCTKYCPEVSVDTQCQKIEFYALSKDTVCTATEQPDSGEIESVLVTCTSGRIYPEGKCEINWSTNGGQKGVISPSDTRNTNLTTETGETPTYYRTECSTTLPVSALGAGEHTFSGKIYPNVTDGLNLVTDNVVADKKVTLSFPEVEYSCWPPAEDVDGQKYFNGKSATCACTLTSGREGRPKGTAVWYKGSTPLSATYTFSYDPTNPSYTCKGSSALGRKDGPSITPLFASLSKNTACTATEQFDLDREIESVMVTCTSERIYPKGKCEIYRSTNGGPNGFISSNEITLKNTVLTGVTPTYYITECSATLAVSVLGEGTHTFSGKIYPDVAGGSSLVAGNVVASQQVALSFPVAKYSCSTDTGQTYFKGRSVTCTCSLTSEGQGRPKGRAAWFKAATNDEMISNTDGSIIFNYTTSEPSYTCKGTSALGKGAGTTITPLFAFVDDVLQLTADKTDVDICSGTSEDVNIACQIPKGNANPDLNFSFSVNGGSVTGIRDLDTSLNYKSDYTLSSTEWGTYDVRCTATNTIFPSQRAQNSVTVRFKKPPTGPPQVTAVQASQTVSGNTLTLSAGYTGDITCRTDGGFPPATITTFSCTRIPSAVVPSNPATLSFSGRQLTSNMDGAQCSCMASHVTETIPGCYDNRQTEFSLNVRYKPEISSFFASSVEVDEGDTTSLSCTGKGNPSPTLSLTRERKGDTFERDITAAASKTVSFTHDTGPLGCLDTDVYNCVATNDEGTSTKSVTVNVKCKPHLAQDPNLDAVLGQTHEVRVQIYGYPTPTLLDLTKADGSKASESVEYRAAQPPFGEVVVTFQNLVAENFGSNYTLTVENGIGGPLTYSFRLNQVSAPAPQSGGGGDSGVIIGVVVAVVVIIVLIAAAVFIILRRKGRVPCLPHKGSEADNSNSKVQSNPMYGSSNDALGPSSQRDSNPYESIPDETTQDPYDSIDDSRNSIQLNGTQGEDNYGWNTAA